MILFLHAGGAERQEGAGVAAEERAGGACGRGGSGGADVCVWARSDCAERREGAELLPLCRRY